MATVTITEHHELKPEQFFSPRHLYSFVQCKDCDWIGPIRDLAIVPKGKEQVVHPQCPECDSERLHWMEVTLPKSNSVH
jgi:hypothetical protein